MLPKAEAAPNGEGWPKADGAEGAPKAAGAPNADGFPNAVAGPGCVPEEEGVPKAEGCCCWPKALIAGRTDDGWPNADTVGVVEVCELNAPNPPAEEDPPKAWAACPNAPPLAGLGEPNALTPNDVTPPVGFRNVELGSFSAFWVW